MTHIKHKYEGYVVHGSTVADLKKYLNEFEDYFEFDYGWRMVVYPTADGPKAYFEDAE
jgi:hypothetical protein